MTRWRLALALLLVGCHERLQHVAYGVSVRDACGADEYTFGAHCISGGAVPAVSVIVSSVLTIWIVLTLRRIAASADRVEAIARRIDEQTKPGE